MNESPLITSSLKAYELLRNEIAHDIEEFWVIGLSSAKRVIGLQCLFRGTVDSCLVHPRDIFRFACARNVSSLLIAHSHPSNDAQPSHEDIRITERLVKCGKLMQIPVLDHLILVESSYTSFLDAGIKPFTKN